MADHYNHSCSVCVRVYMQVCACICVYVCVHTHILVYGNDSCFILRVVDLGVMTPCDKILDTALEERAGWNYEKLITTVMSDISHGFYQTLWVYLASLLHR